MTSLPSRLSQSQPYALGLFRIVTGLLYASHGAVSLFGILVEGRTVPAGAWPGWYAAVIELVGGVLVLLGLGTRSAAFIASGSMAYAYFSVHQSGGLFPIQNGGELAAFFSFAFLLLVFSGPGALALDQLFARGATRATDGQRNAATVTA